MYVYGNGSKMHEGTKSQNDNFARKVIFSRKKKTEKESYENKQKKKRKTK